MNSVVTETNDSIRLAETGFAAQLSAALPKLSATLQAISCKLS